MGRVTPAPDREHASIDHVRPDDGIAWHDDSPPVDALALVDRLRGADSSPRDIATRRLFPIHIDFA